MDVQIVYVDSVSPFKVREASASTAVRARVVSGSSYTPTLNDAVLAVLVKGCYRVWGKA